MSEPTLRPIWTPDDYAQTVRDASHRGVRVEAPADDMKPDVLPTGTAITWKPYFDEAPIPGVIVNVITDDPSFGLLYVLFWLDDHGRVQRTPVTVDRVLTVEHQPDAGARPFWRNPKAPCTCCYAWPLEECEAGCLSRMSPAEQDRHRAEVLDRTLAELNLLEASPRITPPAGWLPVVGRHRAPEPVGMRPGRARVIGRVCVALAVLVLFFAVALLWAGGPR